MRLFLWPDEAPLGDGKSEMVKVPISVHLPEPGLATGAAMVICPGGGYGGRVVEGEGHGIARWLNTHGIAGVVLEYRLPVGNYHRPMLDAQRAILVELLSNEKQVTDKTPPAFLTHARTDAVVPVAHSRMFYEALKAHGVPAEFQELPKGNHGYNGYKGEEWDSWQKRSLEWLGERGLWKSSR